MDLNATTEHKNLTTVELRQAVRDARIKYNEAHARGDIAECVLLARKVDSAEAQLRARVERR